MMRQGTIVLGCSILLLLGSVVPAHAALILNEALANEPGSATTLEWVELLNWPDTGQSISLSGYKYIDGGQTVLLDSGISIPAGGFAILARRPTGASSFEERWGNASGVWGDHSSESYPLSAVSQMSLRNSSDTIRFVSPAGDTSMILWLSDSGDGISIERIRPGADDSPTNFSSCEVPAGSTPGAANSVLPPRGDLAIDIVVIGPVSPLANQPVQFAVRVINRGFGDVTAGTVGLYQAGNLSQPIVSGDFGNVSEGGEASVVLTWERPLPGLTELLLRLNTDADTSNNSYSLSLITRFDKPYLIVSEFLGNPDPGGPEEWIEIANVSGEAISLKQLRIGDSLNTEQIPSGAAELPAGEFTLLVENETAFRAFYPAFAGSVEQIPGWRALNNTGDGIRLIGPSNEIIDSLTFRTTYPGNRSVERVELSATFAAPGDWAASEDDDGATPGHPNSVQRGDPGSLILDSVWLVPESPEWGDTIRVFAAVSNNSFGPASGWSILASRDLDFSSPGANLTDIAESSIPNTDEGESQVIAVIWHDAAPGIHRVHLGLRDESKETVSSSAIVATVQFSQPLLIVSEYMAATTSFGPGEWIEIYNASDFPISLRGIRIGDSITLGTIPPPIPDLAPGDFLLLAADEDRFKSFYNFDGQVISLGNWPSLNDAADLIRIVGTADEVIDSVSYSTTIPQNLSRERRQLEPRHAGQEDWGVSIDPLGATPGRPNSIRRFDNDLSIVTVQMNSLTYTWPADVTGHVRINNEGFSAVDAAVISVDDLTTGTAIAKLATPMGLQPGASVAIPFSFAGLTPARYALGFALEDDENSTNNVRAQTIYVAHAFPSIIVSEFLSDPEPDGPGEWVEIYNAFGSTLSLFGYALGDSVSYTPFFISQRTTLPAGEFAVICEEKTKFMAWYPNFAGMLVETTPWRDLNNDRDRVRLRGASNEIVDSFTYMAGHGDNKSCERLSLLPTFSVPTDWTSSVDPSGATPGRPNSVSAASAGSLQVEVSPNPVYRSAGQQARIDYRLEVGESLTLKIYDRAGRLVRTIADDTPSATGFVEWNGTDDDGYALHPGPYVLLARSEPAGSMKKLVVVIAP